MRGISFKRAAGGGESPPSPSDIARRPTAIAETYSRLGASIGNQAVLQSGMIQASGIPLLQGQVVSSITYFSGSTGAGTPTNQWFALYSPARALLAVTADDTTNPWPANSEKTLAFASPFTVLEDGVYILGIMVAATTVPYLVGHTGYAALLAMAPLLNGRDQTNIGRTTPDTAPATLTLATYTGCPWAYVS